RAELKAALAAVLVKRAEHRAPFAALFDVSFAPRRAEASRPAGAPATLSLPLPADLTEAAVGEGGSEDLLTALLEALRRNDAGALRARSEEHTSELQSRVDLVCRLLLEKKKRKVHTH